MNVLPDADPKVVVCLGAHADDIEIGASGSILLLADRYPEAEFVFIVASAEGGREDEARRSADELLGDRVRVATAAFRDGFLPYDDPAGVKQFIAESATADADIVFAPDRLDAHQDHAFVGAVASQVFRGPPILGYPIPKLDGERAQPNTFVRLPADVAERKLDHLMANFESQHGKRWYRREVFSSSLVLAGVVAGSPSGFAEAFRSDRIVVGIP